MKRFLTAVAAFSAAAWAGYAQEILREGDASYASYTPWSKAVWDPPLPEPYETYADAHPFFEFEDE